MNNESKLIQALWDAFPAGYFERVGTVTRGGYSVITGKHGLPAWFSPNGGVVTKPGLLDFDEARQKLDMLPDVADSTTLLCMRSYLAEQTGISPDNGVFWHPKAGSIHDKSRNVKKIIHAGWTVSTPKQSYTFPMEEKDSVLGLLKAIAMTNCACGRGPQRMCPRHGDPTSKPWK